MALLPLLGGAYVARSPLANAQRCVNLFPEQNPKDSPVPVTHYQRPGLRAVSRPPASGRGRGIWRASNGLGCCVVGQDFYIIDEKWNFVSKGTLQVTGSNICSFVDNGIQGLLVDGSPVGYTVQVNDFSGEFSPLVDSTGIFTGADRVDYMDTFIVWNVPGTNQFGSTLSNEISFSATYLAAKTTYPDLLQSVIVNRHELILVGQVKSEVWYDAGLALFPFSELPGAYFEHGTCAKYSVAAQDINVFWLGQNSQGQGIVFMARGYDCRRVSNYALEFALRKIKQIFGPEALNDAVGWFYQTDGHTFYVLTFPTGDQTWALDLTSMEWHQLAWMDSQGGLHRHRGISSALINNTIVCQDWETGAIYQIDPGYYFDDVVENNPSLISFIRGFPHLVEGEVSLGIENLNRPVPSTGKRLLHKSFMLNMECGEAPLDVNGNPGMVTLRWSDDRGKSFQSTVLASGGAPGEYNTFPLWRGMGIARDRVYEVEYSFAGEAALLGAWVEIDTLGS